MAGGFPVCGNSGTQTPVICGSAISLGRPLNSLWKGKQIGDETYIRLVEGETGPDIHHFSHFPERTTSLTATLD